jgi:uncharacterized membrane protein (DUF485 family)
MRAARAAPIDAGLSPGGHTEGRAPLAHAASPRKPAFSAASERGQVWRAPSRPPDNHFHGDEMEIELSKRIEKDPNYQELKAKRTSFGWWLSLAGMIAYYGFIVLVAFDKPLLARKLGSGVMTVGMPLGVAVIVFTIIITWVYVRRANTEFDALTEKIVKGALK